jgi:transcriptional regulator with XRE-family HTH domain
MTENEKKELLTPMSLRKRVGLTQRKIAQELDIRVQTVGEWEKGGIPRLIPSKMKRLCELYQCSMDELIEAFEENQPHAN